MHTSDVLVVGGGIAGTSTALFCARNGFDVDLIERDTLGGGATTAAAGVLTPPSFLDRSVPPSQQNPYALLSEQAYRFYPSFVDLLKTYSLFEIGFEISGTWHLAFSETELDECRTYYEELDSFDREGEWADGAELRDRYECLDEDVKGGYLYAEEAQVDPGRLMQVMREALEQESVELHEKTEVTDLVLDENGTCREVRTPDASHRAGHVVLAAGCWTNRFSTQIGQSVPVEPRKGQMIKISHTVNNTPMFEWNSMHLVPRMDGTVEAGATVENTGYDLHTTPDARSEIFDVARRVLRNLSSRKIVDQWAGLRPYADRKGGPFLGPVPGTDNVLINAGHYKKGILQGPLSGKCIAQHIAGDEPDLDLHRYRLDR